MSDSVFTNIENLHFTIGGVRDIHDRPGVYRWVTTRWELYVNLKRGDTYSMYGSRRVSSSCDGMIILIAPGTEHTDYIFSDSEGYLIFFDTDRPPMNDNIRIYPPDSRDLRALADSFREECLRKKPGYELRCQSLLYLIFDEMRRLEEASYQCSRSWRLISPAVERIHENYCSASLTVDGLAAECGISPQYFRRLFRQHFGRSPHTYINELRMKTAAELLRTERCTVREAAALCGFEDVRGFTRSFTGSFGCRPSEVKMPGKTGG